MSRDRALEALKILKEQYPAAGPKLKFKTHFELLVAVVLSAQSTDQQVNKVTDILFRNYSKPEDFANMELELLEELIKGVGLYKNKSRFLKELSGELLDKYNGIVPSNMELLLKLPGVGRKTANVVMAVGFNKPGLGVDTHVKRVSRRLGLTKESRADKIEFELKEILPDSLWGEAHHLLIFHGRKVCKARKPECSNCVLNHICTKADEHTK